MVSDMSSSISIEMESELLGSQVSKDVTVPRVVGGDGKQMFIRKSIINWSVLRSGRQIINEFNED